MTYKEWFTRTTARFDIGKRGRGANFSQPAEYNPQPGRSGRCSNRQTCALRRIWDYHTTCQRQRRGVFRKLELGSYKVLV